MEEQRSEMCGLECLDSSGTFRENGLSARHFEWQEYLVFVLVLALSMGIGIYYGFIRKNLTNDDFLMGGRQMSVFPVTLSIICSFISAITLLGNPVEVYFYGVVSNYLFLSFITMTISIAYLYLPVFYNLKLTSAYHYVELRFNRTARVILSTSAIIHLLIYMPLTIWGPSLALDQVAGIDKYWASSAIFLVCIAYSTMGGLKAVLWSDVLQGVVMFGSMITVIILGTNEIGGINTILERANAGGRINFNNFDTDYRTRYTFWSGMFAGYFTWILVYIGTQAQIQRYLCVPTLAKARLCVFYNLLGLITILILCTILGLLIFAKYSYCDPIKAKFVSSSDQLLPFFVMDVLGQIPGLPGLFVAGLTSGSLSWIVHNLFKSGSSVSSALNAIPAIIVEDFVRPAFPQLSDTQLSQISKLISLIGGLISFGLIFVVPSIGGIIQFSYILHGALLGPVVGIFTLGMFFPWANSIGSMLSIIPSLAITLFIGIGTVMAGNSGKLPNQVLPLRTDGCSGNLSSFEIVELNSSLSWKDVELAGFNNLFAISYVWQPAITVVSTVVFGLILSMLANMQKPFQRVKSKYLSPPILKFWMTIFSSKKLSSWIEFE